MNSKTSGGASFGFVLSTAAALAAVAYSPASRAAPAVTNCSDDGAGSLRAAIAGAGSGDTIDLRALRCTVLLTSGEIVAPQHDLRLLGRGDEVSVVTSGYRSRIFNHTGAGTLTIQGIALIEAADTRQYASGGCIRSGGAVVLDHARLNSCIADGERPPDCEGTPCSAASGGAIWALGRVLMLDSTISDSSVSSYDSYGGAVLAGGRLTLVRSRLLRNSGNFVGAANVGSFTAMKSIVADSQTWDGCAIDVSGRAEVYDSAFVRNVPPRGGSGGSTEVLCAAKVNVANSTFSRNAGGAVIHTDEPSVFNSTIAFNDSCRGMVFAPYGMGYGTLQLESSIVARNTCGNAPMDLVYVGAVAGSHNLIGTSTVQVPADTLRVDPQLAPLARNGGLTPTHALLITSPAIDGGSDVLGLRHDQRGDGFPRVKQGFADIGAFER